MSFTIKVKEEIIAASSKDKAELSALIKMSGSVGLTNQGLTLSISTENAKIARHIYQLMESRYQSNPELRHHNKTNLKKNRVYTVLQLTMSMIFCPIYNWRILSLALKQVLKHQ